MKAKDANLIAGACLKAGNFLGISRNDLSEIIALKWETPDRIAESSLLVISIYQSLYSIFGGDEVAMKEWLHSYNSIFEKSPFKAMQNFIGLTEVASYLDSRHEYS